MAQSQEAPSLETPQSQEAPPSPAKSNSIITEAANPIHDFKNTCVKVHSYLMSARSLSHELKKLQATHQIERIALEHRIDECYQQAYDLSKLSC